MLNLIDYKTVLIFIACALPCFCAIYYYARAESLSNRIAVYEAQIALLNEQYNADKDKFAAAQAKAEDQVKEASKQSEAILNQKVSKDCKKAVKWGAMQGKKIK